MGRTQSKTGRSKGTERARRPVRLPEQRKKRTASREGPATGVLRGLGILFSCVLVGGIAFAAGGYLGLVVSVQKLDEPRTHETHPTYIYSAPLGSSDDSRRVIGTIFEGQNRKTASLSQMPPQLLDAAVAKEDERFGEHGGVDLWGIMRALYVDVRAGAAVEGRAPSPSSTSGTRTSRKTVP
jgi:membrane peptidoglycan carboxypeptidase